METSLKTRCQDRANRHERTRSQRTPSRALDLRATRAGGRRRLQGSPQRARVV